jgi:two-component system, chemotaxis family, sensor kinase CheA
MTDADLPRRLLATFVGELEEQIREMNAALLRLESAPGDAEALRTLFRSAHTVKGAARVAGVPAVERACDHLETLLAVVRSGERHLQDSDFALLFAAADALEESAGRIRAARPLEDGPLAALLPRLADAAGVEPDRVPPRGGTPDPGAAFPPAAVPPAAAPPRAAGGGAAAPIPADDTVRVAADKLDALLAVAGELRVLAGRAAVRAPLWDRLEDALRMRLFREAGANGGGLASLIRELDTLIAGGREDARVLGRVADDLSAGVRATRIRPFADIAEPLPRAVRDIAAASGKRIACRVEGRDVEADRLLVDALREPLLHLVRNAADHGIEPPAERAARGKPEQGTVSVSARLTAGRFIVEVSDDGAGVDEAALRAELRHRGRPAPASRDELTEALVAGGLSTRREAGEFSGRGVGLDVVRTAVERVGGSIDVSWRPGEGTTVRLDTPPSPAALRALLVAVGAHVFALPLGQVRRVLRVRADAVRTVEGRPTLPTDDGALPLLHLAAALGPPLAAGRVADLAPAVVLAAGGRDAVFLVDALLGDEEIFVRPLAHDAGVHMAGGGALLPSGRLALLLNPASLVQTAAGGRAGLEATAPPRAARILVVDDSITTRVLEQGVLESAGYRVATEPDGRAAWERLATESFDLVVADIEMPRMDGIELTRRIRGDASLAELPVILVTALGGEEDRRRGLDAGADAYIAKSSFDQATLLETVRQLLDTP